MSPIATFTPTPELQPITIGTISRVPADEVLEIDVEINSIAAFTDPNPLLDDIAVWTWGDGTSTTEANVTSPAEAGHAYAEAGMYEAELTVTSNSNGVFACSAYGPAVIRDPSRGFVTGGGRIDLSEGAYVDNSALTGKVTFAFVSKYTKGKAVPTSNTQLRFNVANLYFSSDRYYWLVVTGDNKAIFAGEGTIGGLLAPHGQPHKFRKWAADGEPDTFSVRIWWETLDGTDHDVYDNCVCNSEMNQPIGGGSIIVHKGKGK